MSYTGGCAVNCVAGSATVGNNIQGYACCKTSFCNSSAKVKATKTMIALVLVVIMVMSIFRI